MLGEDACCVIVFIDLQKGQQPRYNMKKCTHRRSNFALRTGVTRASSQALSERENRNTTEIQMSHETSLCRRVPKKGGNIWHCGKLNPHL